VCAKATGGDLDRSGEADREAYVCAVRVCVCVKSVCVCGYMQCVCDMRCVCVCVRVCVWRPLCRAPDRSGKADENYMREMCVSVCV